MRVCCGLQRCEGLASHISNEVSPLSHGICSLHGLRDRLQFDFGDGTSILASLRPKPALAIPVQDWLAVWSTHRYATLEFSVYEDGVLKSDVPPANLSWWKAD